MEPAFLKCITDAPGDVTARLVFADWLCEQDDPARAERGEFIHLQHALASGRAPRHTRPALVARQNELLGRHREQWEAPFRELAGGCEYRNGFAERVTLRAEQLVDNFPELIERTPVVRVRLSGLTPDTVDFVAEVDALARLRELDLNRQPIEPRVLRTLLRSPHLGALRSLNLVRTGVGDEGVRALLGSHVFDRLHYLNLSHTNVSAAGLRELVSAIYHRGAALRVLVLRGAPRLPPGAFPPLPHGTPFPLRQSLQAQIGLEPAPRDDTLAQLYARRAGLSGDLRQWVEWLRAHGPTAVPRAVGALPLPDRVREAFARVCERRVVWRAERSGADLPALLLTADGSTDLAEALRVLLGMADRQKEAQALVGCLLDLYLRHERNELPADGRTRGR